MSEQDPINKWCSFCNNYVAQSHIHWRDANATAEAPAPAQPTMKHPTAAFLIELCSALREAEHKNVAGHFAAGFLWALYPDWFDKNSPTFCKAREIESILEREYERTFPNEK